MQAGDSGFSGYILNITTLYGIMAAETVPQFCELD